MITKPISSFRRSFSNRLFAFAFLSAYVNILMAVTTPFMGDDFGIIFSGTYISSLNDSWVDTIRTVNTMISDGTHVNYLGQLISVIWYKTWINFSLANSLPLFYGFFILKLVLWVAFLESSKCVIRKILGVQRFNSTFFYLSFGILFQIRAAWSHDPFTSYPFAGLFAGICLIYGVAYTTFAVKRNHTFHYLMLTPITILVFLAYEINIGLLAYQFYLVFMLNEGVRTRSRVNGRLFASVLISGILILLIIMNYAGDKSSYPGTSISNQGFKGFGETYVSNLLSVFPMFSWNQVLALFNLQLPFFWPVILLIIGFVGIFGKIEISPFLDQMRIRMIVKSPLMPIALMAMTSVAVQSLTVKIQEETKGASTVYTYLIPLIFFWLAFFTNILERFRMRFQDGFGFYLVCFFLLIQTCLNFGVNQIVWNSYKSNTHVVKAITSDLSMQERCEIITNWNRADWPNYYRIETNLGLNHLSKITRGENFCDK